MRTPCRTQHYNIALHIGCTLSRSLHTATHMSRDLRAMRNSQLRAESPAVTRGEVRPPLHLPAFGLSAGINIFQNKVSMPGIMGHCEDTGPGPDIRQ